MIEAAPPTTSPLAVPEQPHSAEDARLQAAARTSAAHFEQLCSQLNYLDIHSIAQVRSAWQFADQAHRNQWRSSGDPYITHPIAVTGICAQWKLDAPALMAALLHDAMEDCGITRQDLVQRFGDAVAALVDGLTKLDKLQFTTREEGQAESFRKMLLAMSKDVRVILIKLADRTHNMRTMGDMPRSKWARISGETLDIYAPIAHRLGLNQTYRELQDLAFRHLHPWRYATLEKAAARSRIRRQAQVQRVHDEIAAEFNRHALPARLTMREHTLYSIYRKMEQHRLSFGQVTDIHGLRLIVSTALDCYTALGVLHQLYKPVPGRFKDYIAIAKKNGYQSLHTTLAGPAGASIECQLRTEAMHIVAEAGIAAHWLRQAHGSHTPGDTTVQTPDTRWLQSLLDIQNETRDAAEFWDNVKVDLCPDAVYVFTPKNKVFAMPTGATVVDFAYAIHSKIGDRMTSALVNGQPVPPRTALKSGDVVHILTDDAAQPDPSWLGFVKTGRARSAIRHYLKTAAQHASIALGEKLLAQALREEGVAALPADDAEHSALWHTTLQKTGCDTRASLLSDIGMGRQAAGWVARHMAAQLAANGQRPDVLLLTQGRFAADKPSQGMVTLDGTDHALITYAPCCRPVPGDDIVSYLEPGRGLQVHRAECVHTRRLHSTDAERFVPVEWGEDSHQRLYASGISVTLRDTKGTLARVAHELAQADVDIRRMDMDDEVARHTTTLRFTVTVRERQQVEAALRNLRRVASVLQAQRILPDDLAP